MKRNAFATFLVVALLMLGAGCGSYDASGDSGSAGDSSADSSASSSMPSDSPSSAPADAPSSPSSTDSAASGDSMPKVADLTQAAVYDILLNAGYTGVSKFSTTYYGLDNAVQSQSINYTLIGQVKDVAALKSSLPEFNDSNIKVEQGEWVFATNYKIGILSKLADLRNIQ